MDWLGWLAVAVVGAIVIGIALYWGAFWGFVGWALLRNIRTTRLEGLKMGILVQKPNGTATELESELMNEILKAGGSCVTLDRAHFPTLFQGKSYVSTTGSVAPFQVMLLGQFVERPVKASFCWKIDFRCVAAKGEIIGAGSFERSGPASHKMKYLKKLAKDVVRRISVRCNEHAISVSVNNSPPTILPASR